MTQTYTEADLGVLVAGEWALVGGLGAAHKTGEGVIATLRESPDEVWNHPHDMALPFPFTLEQFRAFCAWHPTFEWEAVESPFTNDDGSLDEVALGELAKRGATAADLVRRVLTGASDEAEIASHQGAPTRNGARAVINRLGSQSNRVRRDVLTPAIEAAQKQCGNQFDPPSVWGVLVQMAQDRQRPLLGLTEEGIKWNDANDNPQFLSLRNLRDRLRRSREKTL